MISSPPHVTISRLVQRMTGKSSYRLLAEFPHLRRRFWGRHVWGRGSFCRSSGNVTDEVIKASMAQQSHDSGLNEHGVFSCAKCCLPAHKQGWGNPWETEVGKKCPRWVVTRDAAWYCKPDNGNIAVLKRTLLSILHSNRGKIA